MRQVLLVIAASLLIAPIAANADLILEVESNDSASTAQNIDGSFDLSINPLIGDAAYVNTSTTIPHAEIAGTGDGTYDWYSFTVATAGSVGIFDIDCAWQNQSGECAGSGLFTSSDVFIDLFDTDGVTPLRDANAYDEGYDDGSNSFPTATQDAGSTGSFGLDPFVTYTFATPGTYFIRVGECCGFTDPNDYTSAFALEPLGDYLLNVSISTSGAAFILQQTITTGQSGFGSPVALDGGTGLAGAQGGTGSASTFSAINGQALQSFANPNPSTSGTVATDFYANSVDLSNGRILIGAQAEDLAASDSGAAYLFDAGTGALLHTFTHPNPIPDFGGVGFGQGIGRDVALEGDFALVGSVAREAFLFDAVTGNLIRTFSGPTPPTSLGYGDTVALSPQFVAIGDITNNGSTGAVHLFDLTTGSFIRTIANPTPSSADFFGEEIAISGNRILIGAGQVDVGGMSNAGEAYLFNVSTGQLLQTFTDPTANINAFFGRSLDIEGDTVAIGAANDNEVHIFDAVTGAFVQTIVEQSVQSQFGNSVDLDAGNLLVGSPFGSAFLYGPTTTSVVVPADDCTAVAGGCNPTGGHEIVLPENFVVPPGGTITQTPTLIVDPRVDQNGRCDGQTPLVLFGGDLIIPPHLCGSPEFEVLETVANFDILEGTIQSTMYPEVFVNNALDCIRPIIGDPQLQDVVVWQPTDGADVIEGHALELTFDCGSSRGKTRGLSFYVVGLHIDFGLDFDQDPQAVTQGFIDLTSNKFASLTTATRNARSALRRRDSFRLAIIGSIARWHYQRGRYQRSSRLLELFISLTERAQFDSSGGFNHEGNLLSRANNIKFTIDEKITPFDN